MIPKSEFGKMETAWNEIFAKYGIAERVAEDGSFAITASQIKEFREPRLMAKFDHRHDLPKVFSANGLGILPVTRGTYSIGPYDLFAKLKPPEEAVPTSLIPFPDAIESISADGITSETVALNCAFDAGVLARFLGEERLLPTVAGRAGARPFDFRIRSCDRKRVSTLSVNGAQIEVDGAYESRNSLSLFEAKMHFDRDFIVRQLYYPFRHFSASGVTKPIRTIYLVYSSGMFDLSEYGFEDPFDYSSVKLLRSERYRLDSAGFSRGQLFALLAESSVSPEPPDIPFPQANSFERVVNLCERLAAGPLSKSAIAACYGFDERQSDYYLNAAIYLGLARRDALGRGSAVLSSDGAEMLRLPFRKRARFLAERLLRHEIFRRILRMVMTRGAVPETAEIEPILRETNPRLGAPGKDTFGRRASTVRNWIKWLLEQTEPVS